MDQWDLVLHSRCTGALMALLEDIRLPRISLRPRVVLEITNSVMASEQLCEMARPDTYQIVQEV
jgi:hypothetical protein